MNKKAQLYWNEFWKGKAQPESGSEFSEDMLFVFERFEVVGVKNNYVGRQKKWKLQ